VKHVDQAWRLAPYCVIGHVGNQLPVTWSLTGGDLEARRFVFIIRILMLRALFSCQISAFSNSHTLIYHGTKTLASSAGAESYFEIHSLHCMDTYLSRKYSARRITTPEVIESDDIRRDGEGIGGVVGPPRNYQLDSLS
jgi:hypothetical protein